MTTTDEKRPWPGARPLWQPGQSGNPSGMPKGRMGLAAMVREATRDGLDLLEFFRAVMEGTVPSTSRGRLKPRRATRDQQMRAAEWLADRGVGKAIQTTDLNLSGFEGVDIRLLGPGGTSAEKGEEGGE